MSARSTKHDTLLRIQEALGAALPRSVKVHGTQSDSGFDVRINGTRVRVRWVGECGLRQASEVVALTRSRPNIVVARRASPGARDALSKAGIGWVDETGAAEIALGQLVVSRSGRTNKEDEKPPRWTPAVLSVAEALLCGAKATVSATAAATTLSVASCTNSLRALTDLKFLTSDAVRGRDSARRITDASALLDAYAVAASARSRSVSLTVGVTWRDLMGGLSETGKRWEKSGIAWAATGSAAAAVLAPYLTTVTTGEVYLGVETIAGLEAAAIDVGLQPIEGGRVTLRPFPTIATQILTEKRKGLCVAPWPRVYADLRRSGVRGEEAAEHLRKVLNGG